MIQLSKEETLQRYKAYFNKINPIKPIQPITQQAINLEVDKTVKDILKEYPINPHVSIHYSPNQSELWRNFIMTFLIEYHNKISPNEFIPYDIVDFYTIVDTFIGNNEDHKSIYEFNSPILFLKSEMLTPNRETDNIIMQTIQYRDSMPHTKRNPKLTILLTQMSIQRSKVKIS